MHKPPSRIRYEASHRVVPIRVSQEVYEHLQELRGKGQSYGDTLRVGIDIQETNLQPLQQRINSLELENLELAELVERRTIRCPCYVCNELLTVESEQAKEVCREALRGRLRHSTCKG